MMVRWAIFTVAFLAAPSLFAQNDAARKAFKNGNLSACGEFERIVSMEKIPSRNRYVTEALTTHDRHYLRIPLVLERKDDAWSVAWAPVSEFCVALKNLVTAGVLAKADGQIYSSAIRLPAFPVVATQKRIVTPFGAVESVDGFALNEGLAKHTQRWVREVYGNDPAPAAFDVICDGQLGWDQFNAIVLSVSSIGLYLINVVTVGTEPDATLSMVQVAAPVSTLISADKPAKGTIAVYSVQSKIGVRVVAGNEIQKGDAPCVETMTFCAADPGDVAQKTRSYFDDLKSNDFVLLAATSRQSVQSMVALVGPLSTLGLAPHHFIVGYIQGAK